MPIVEVGAGLGYWVSLLQKRGVDIIAYDIARPGEGGFTGGLFGQAFTEVKWGDHNCVTKHQNRALMIQWPYAPGSGGPKWDVECLDLYTGDMVIYSGDFLFIDHQHTDLARYGEGVIPDCASKEFLIKLNAEFDIVRRMPLPNFPGVISELIIFKRKSSARNVGS